MSANKTRPFARPAELSAVARRPWQMRVNLPLRVRTVVQRSRTTKRASAGGAGGAS